MTMQWGKIAIPHKLRFSLHWFLQVGMMLRGMGFDATTSVYVAAGKIYRAEKYMAPLRQLFPLLETKETLATEVELAPFQVPNLSLYRIHNEFNKISFIYI